MLPLLPSSVQNLLRDFERLPGVGPKSAQRMVFSLLHRPAAEIERFAADLRMLGTTKTCTRCGMLSEQDQCAMCRDPQREQTLICVVETPVDLIAVERTGQYHGLYHVLGGVLSPLESIGPEQLTIASLLRRVREEKPKEVILALNPSTEGDITTLYLQGQLMGGSATVTRLAQGLPTGAALEFADDLTIARALAGRREVQPSVVPAKSVEHVTKRSP